MRLSETTDADLLARAGVDFEAVAELYRRYVRRVTAFAARRCRTPADVADVVAGTFDRLMRSAARYDPSRGPVASFVFAIADSEVVGRYRREAQQYGLVSRLVGRDLLDADDISRIEAAIDATAAVAALEPALDALPTGEREVLRLVAAGYSPTEAAHQLDITPNAARVRLARARQRIRSYEPKPTPPGSTTPPQE